MTKKEKLLLSTSPNSKAWLKNLNQVYKHLYQVQTRLKQEPSKESMQLLNQIKLVRKQSQKLPAVKTKHDVMCWRI